MGHGRDLNELQEVFCRYEFHCPNRRWLYVKKLCKGNIGQFQMLYQGKMHLQRHCHRVTGFSKQLEIFSILVVTMVEILMHHINANLFTFN